MDKRLAEVSLIIFIVCIFTFAASMGWFIIFKERVCKVNINSDQCFESYGAFVQNELMR